MLADIYLLLSKPKQALTAIDEAISEEKKTEDQIWLAAAYETKAAALALKKISYRRLKKAFSVKFEETKKDNHFDPAADQQLEAEST